MIEINIKMYGVFQEYLSDHIKLFIPEKTSIILLKNILIEKFCTNDFCNFDYILYKSVFSDNKKVLDDTYILCDKETIYLLPPFSGG